MVCGERRCDIKSKFVKYSHRRNDPNDAPTNPSFRCACGLSTRCEWRGVRCVCVAASPGLVRGTSRDQRTAVCPRFLAAIDASRNLTRSCRLCIYRKIVAQCKVWCASSETLGWTKYKLFTVPQSSRRFILNEETQRPRYYILRP